MEEKEIWVDIKGFESAYQVSNMGRVYSKPHKRWSPRNNCFCNYKGRLMALAIRSKETPYKCVSLTINKEEKLYNVHRLVAEACIPNPENKKEVNHKDGDKSNNKATNLEWATRSENALHSVNVLKKNTRDNHGGRKISLDAANEMRRMFTEGEGVSMTEIGAMFDIKNPSAVIKGRVWGTENAAAGNYAMQAVTVSKDGKTQRFESIAAASEHIGLKAKNVSYAICNNRMPYKGYVISKV